MGDHLVLTEAKCRHDWNAALQSGRDRLERIARNYKGTESDEKSTGAADLIRDRPSEFFTRTDSFELIPEALDTDSPSATACGSGHTEDSPGGYDSIRLQQTDVLNQMFTSARAHQGPLSDDEFTADATANQEQMQVMDVVGYECGLVGTPVWVASDEE